MLSDSGPAIRLPREEVIMALMEQPNSTWKQIISEGAKSVQFLLQLETIKEVQKVLHTNTKVCASAGGIYVHQLTAIFMDMLNLYHLYSEQINAAVAQQGAIAVRLTLFKAMRSVKTEILELMSTFLEVSKEAPGGPQTFAGTFMTPLMNEVLPDYRASPPASRDAKVLTLFATAISTLRDLISAEVPRIMEAVFEPTLEMITTNMLDHPEHRIGFFHFLREANEFCFYGLFSIAPQHQKLVVDSIVWAFKHTERNISETGLEILQELLQNIAPNPQVSQPFYQTFLLSLIQDVMGVLTDRLHKSGFKLQAGVLMHLFHVVQTGQVGVPLFDTATVPEGTDNASFLKEHVAGLLMTAFPNLTKAQVVSFVMGLFDINLDLNAFKQHLRDFLITVKEFASEDNSELFVEETEAGLEETRQQQWRYRASVPGLLKPSELEADNDMDPDL
jgi:exportin-1